MCIEENLSDHDEIILFIQISKKNVIFLFGRNKSFSKRRKLSKCVSHDRRRTLCDFLFSALKNVSHRYHQPKAICKILKNYSFYADKIKQKNHLKIFS